MENVMTKEGLEALRQELERLETVGRQEIAQQIKVAREFGDLKENAEYHAAKEAQGHLETRILQLREQLETATVVEVEENSEVVVFGSTVDVEDEDTGRRMTYTLVSAREQDPSNGKLSFEAPVGAALRGLRAGEVAEVQTPKGIRRLRVLSVG
jgi:transcription elongation factor GreA